MVCWRRASTPQPACWGSLESLKPIPVRRRCDARSSQADTAPSCGVLQHLHVVTRYIGPPILTDIPFASDNRKILRKIPR